MQKTLLPLLKACKIASLAGLFVVVSSVYLMGFSQPKTATAAASSTINFQARLMTAAGAIVPDGNYNVEFKIYNASSSTGSSQGSCGTDANCLWVETRTSGNVVHVANGYLTVELGSVTALPSIDWSQNLYLTMNIGGTGTPAWDGEMSPRLHLTAVPHAFTADKLAATNGANLATLGFVQPTANRSVLVPDESGTLCIQNSANCGFALSSGSANYIQNQNSADQTANFRISGSGRAATSMLAPLFDTASAGTLAIGTTNATAINLNKATTVTGNLAQSGGTISLAGNGASSISTTSGALTLQSVNSSTAIVVTGTVGTPSITMNTGASGTISIGTTSLTSVTVGSAASTVNIATSTAAHTVHIADGGTGTQSVTIGSTNGSSATTIQGGTGASAINFTSGSGGKINFTAAGAGGVNATIGSTGFNIKTTTNSTTALAVQDSGNSYIFSVDTTSGMVTLGAIQATYSGFDGFFNTPLGSLTLGGTNGATTLLGNTSMKIQASTGTFTTTVGFTTPTANRTINFSDESGTVCLQTSTNCGFAAASGSANYIQNSTTAQSANMYVQAATSGSVAATLRANAAGAGDILDLKNGAGTNVATFGSGGAVLLKTSTDSTSAFQVQDSTGASVLNVDTSSGRIGIGGVTFPSVTLDVSGAIQQTGLMTSDTQGIDAGKWTQLGTCTLTAQYQQCLTTINIIGGHDGTTGDNTFATVHVRVKQQNAMGGAPYVNVTLDPSMSVINKDAISAVTTTNTGTTTTVQLWGKITNSFEHWFFTPVMNTGNSGAATWTWSRSAGFSAALPAGTVTNATYATTLVDTLTVRNATNSANALQIQNAAGTSIFNVDTNSGLISQSVGLRLNVNATTADTFTTPLGSSVKTAINIPLYDPGAFGQILAFGIPSTAATTARAISVFDARASGTIQPAIALFSPNENDLFGLSWNGLNTTASLETASAAIALRPGGTNVKLWAGSTGVAIGSNVSSAAYPLDVTGDINTSTAYRIGGTSVCDTTGGTGCIAKSGSGFYIHNQTTVQSANFYVQSASSGTATATLQANATSGNILNLVSGSGTTISTVSNSGAISYQNSANSTTAFQINALNTNNVLRVDTVNERVAVGVISDPIGAKLSIATSSTVALRAYQGGISDAFQLGNNTADFLTIGSTGNFLLKPTTDSASAMRIQNNAGTSMFTVDTAGTDVLIGSSTTDANPILLALDSYNGSSDPTGIAGAMYYSTTYNAMRCYQDGSWSNCSDPTRLSHGFNIQEEFVASSSSGANYTCGSGTMGATYAWACNASGTGASVAPVTADLYSRPGQMQLSTGTTTTGVASAYLAGGTTPAFFIGGGESFETAVNIPTLSTATQDYLIRVGFCDNNAHGGACSNGAYFEYNRSSSTSWVGKTVKGGTSVSTATTKTVATGWTNLKFVATSANSVTFYVKGPGETSYTSLGAIGSASSVPNASANATTMMYIIDRTAGAGTAASTFKVDYADYWNDLSTVR